MVTKKVGFSRVAPALAVLGMSLFASSQASAAISGTVDVSLIVSEYGCEVGVGDGAAFEPVAAAAGATINDFGTLDFGQVRGGNWNYALSAEMWSTAGGNTGKLVVQCTLATGSDASFTVAVDGGQHLEGAQRYLVLNSTDTPAENERIGYGVYQDSARSIEYTPGVPGPSISAPNGESVPVPIFGAIPPNPQITGSDTAKVIPTDGSYYQDTLVVSIDFTIN